MSYIDPATGNRRSNQFQVEPHPPPNNTMPNDDNISDTSRATSLPSHQPPHPNIAPSSSTHSNAPLREIITPTHTDRQIPPPPAPVYPSVHPSTEPPAIPHETPNAQNPVPVINHFATDLHMQQYQTLHIQPSLHHTPTLHNMMTSPL